MRGARLWQGGEGDNRGRERKEGTSLAALGFMLLAPRPVLPLQAQPRAPFVQVMTETGLLLPRVDGRQILVTLKV